jgi:hypothetical protein
MAPGGNEKFNGQLRNSTSVAASWHCAELVTCAKLRWCSMERNGGLHWHNGFLRAVVRLRSAKRVSWRYNRRTP